jgi:hypothetical protein
MRCVSLIFLKKNQERKQESCLKAGLKFPCAVFDVFKHHEEYALIGPSSQV